MVTYDEIYESLENMITKNLECKIIPEKKMRNKSSGNFNIWHFTDGEREFEITIKVLI